MSNDEMNALVTALQSSLTKAQSALDRRQEQTIKRMIDLAEDGSPEFVTWRCPLLSGDGRIRSHELLRVPWASLASQTMMEISELSVSLKHPERWLPENGFSRKDGEIPTGGGTEAGKGPIGSMKIQLQGEGGRAGAVICDDIRVGSIGPDGVICEVDGVRNRPHRMDAPQEKAPQPSGRARSIGIGVAIFIAVLFFIGLAAWLIL